MRLFRLLPLMLFLLLCGCQGGEAAAGGLPDLDPNSMAEGSRGRAPGALSDPALPGRPLPDLDHPGSLP